MWPQEPDEVAAGPIRAVTALAVLLTLGLSALALGLQQQWQTSLGGPRPVPSPIRAEGTPPSDLFKEARPERTGLPDEPVWVDRERGVVALPVEDAVDLVLREQP